MGTKIDRFEESTKITSSSEIDEMLKQARSAPAPAFDDDDDDVGDFEEHTQIGNVAELAARSMTIEDPTPRPAPMIGRASTNVIRRNTPLPMPAVRPPSASESTPMPRAQGSLSEITPPVAKTDDEAFDAWEEHPVASASQPMQAMTAEVYEPPPPVMQLPLAPPVEMTPFVEAVMPSVVKGEPAARKAHWGLIAWVALLAVFATVCTIGYMRIQQLEQQLAQAKSQLK